MVVVHGGVHLKEREYVMHAALMFVALLTSVALLLLVIAADVAAAVGCTIGRRCLLVSKGRLGRLASERRRRRVLLRRQARTNGPEAARQRQRQPPRELAAGALAVVGARVLHYAQNVRVRVVRVVLALVAELVSLMLRLRRLVRVAGGRRGIAAQVRQGSGRGSAARSGTRGLGSRLFGVLRG